MADDRLTELETRYTFLERLVEDLSQVLREQQRSIDTLALRMTRLEALVTEVLEGTDSPHNEKPPHY